MFITFFLVCVFIIEPLLARDYFVAPASKGGSDANDGRSPASPFLTWTKVASVVAAGDVVQVAGGTYRETLQLLTSGTPSAPIIWRFNASFDLLVGGDGKQPATLSAADVVEMARDEQDATLWRSVASPLPPSQCLGPPASNFFRVGRDQLWLNGKMMNEAREPNLPLDLHAYNTHREHVHLATSASQTLGDPNTTGIIHHPSLLKYATNELVKSSISFLGACHWDIMSGEVMANDGDTVTFTFPRQIGRWYDIGAYNNDVHFFLWGLSVLLDGEGEWIRLFGAAPSLLLRPPSNLEPTSSVVEVLARRFLINYSGVSYNHFEDLHFFGGDIRIGSQSWEPYAPAHATVFRSCLFEYIGHFQHLHSFWADLNVGVTMRGDDMLVEDSTIRYGAQHGVRMSGSRNVVRNCVLHSLGGAGRHGRFIGFEGEYNVAEYNTVFNSSGTGLIEQRGSRYGVVRFNDVSHAAKWVSDGGHIFFSRNERMDSVVAYNFIHHHYEQWNMTYGMDGVASACYAGSAGIYSEGNVTNVTIAHNVIWPGNSNMKRGISLPSLGPFENFQIYYNTMPNLSFEVNNDLAQASTTIAGNAAHDMLNWHVPATNYRLENNTFTNYEQSGGNTRVNSLDLHSSVPFVPKLSSPLCAKMAGGAASVPATVDAQVDGGASPCSRRSSPPFVAGARVLPRELALLVVYYNNTDDNKLIPSSFRIDNLPLGRRLPVDTARVFILTSVYDTPPSIASEELDWVVDMSDVVNVDTSVRVGNVKASIAASDVVAQSSSLESVGLFFQYGEDDAQLYLIGKMGFNADGDVNGANETSLATTTTTMAAVAAPVSSSSDSTDYSLYVVSAIIALVALIIICLGCCCYVYCVRKASSGAVSSVVGSGGEVRRSSHASTNTRRSRSRRSRRPTFSGQFNPVIATAGRPSSLVFHQDDRQSHYQYMPTMSSIETAAASSSNGSNYQALPTREEMELENGLYQRLNVSPLRPLPPVPPSRARRRPVVDDFYH